ncbi:hypothetical protein [Streptomyces sp. ME19-01-6]|uniref:hypothetical protein n=1 Tax=Streptomyces sp. ME19-01-6 TaxID=3028686 RepID=UPI0029A83147|nr:hypothetical protein [Streptomyces sp. ME19-01-6]MDX3232939.1 hypothetical protein [Streptomyces sp. ME19-01-6]
MTTTPASLPPEHEVEIREWALGLAAAYTAWLNKFSPLYEDQQMADTVEVLLKRVPALLAELDRARAQLVAAPAEWDCAHGTAEDEPFCQELDEDEHPTCPTVRVHRDDVDRFAAMVDMVHELRNRVTELERSAVEGRAALANLIQDHEDPGTAALGALYLLSQATTSVNAQPDDAARALARHDAATLDSAADELMNQADRLAGQYADSDITGDGPTAVLETWGRAEEVVRRLATRAVKGAVR